MDEIKLTHPELLALSSQQTEIYHSHNALCRLGDRLRALAGVGHLLTKVGVDTDLESSVSGTGTVLNEDLWEAAEAADRAAKALNPLVKAALSRKSASARN